MAGASAIPYGKVLVQREMEDLFDKLFACKAPNYSPKGKPVINIITIEDLDRNSDSIIIRTCPFDTETLALKRQLES
jgi:DNA mismatch repair protein MutL